MPTARHRPNARTLVALAGIVSVGLFLYGAAWSIAHGGNWEDSARTQPRVAVRSAIDALIVSPDPTDPLNSQWLLDPANRRPADGTYNIVLADRTRRNGPRRYCATRTWQVVANVASDEVNTVPLRPGSSDVLTLPVFDVLTEFDHDDCFPTLRTMVTIDANGRVTTEERPDPTGPVWGYFVFAFSWLPLATAWVFTRRHRRRRADTPT